ncbi:hypothetical protein AWZ03_003484 [Drosophila navojoa]|uniref:Uncharacterized protein n=1 Tax=Drosophila navojoa TaxID=7232 RepID=A0A484BMR5_DRONA|nr:hypothetical protein AWZ03_003484 [Drosophila navojoa]
MEFIKQTIGQVPKRRRLSWLIARAQPTEATPANQAQFDFSSSPSTSSSSSFSFSNSNSSRARPESQRKCGHCV